MKRPKAKLNSAWDVTTQLQWRLYVYSATANPSPQTIPLTGIYTNQLLAILCYRECLIKLLVRSGFYTSPRYFKITHLLTTSSELNFFFAGARRRQWHFSPCIHTNCWLYRAIEKKPIDCYSSGYQSLLFFEKHWLKNRRRGKLSSIACSE